MSASIEKSIFGTERDFTRWLAKRSAGRARGLRLGIGDDAALVESRAGFQWIVTSDLCVEGVHFLANLHPPKAIGHRALARSLSDVAAMGGLPRFALVSLALPRSFCRRWIEAFFTGIFCLARRFNVSLIGGDTTLNAGLAMADVTVLGEVRRGRALLRSGARLGDYIFVAGELGYSALGLHLLKSSPADRSVASRKAVWQHLYPEPQCRLGALLAERRIASSAIDLSDGLSTDLNRLAEASGVGARVWADQLPVPSPLISRGSPPSTLELALQGGEDYILLFTVPRSRINRVPHRFKGAVIHRIGEVQESRLGVQIVQNGKPVALRPEGYDHFRTGASWRDRGASDPAT
jgi:thiamine-monophosphate kinase